MNVAPPGHYTIYHNPRCSKSRAALALLREHGIEPEIVDYLKHAPAVAELRALITALQLAPRKIVRRSEPVWRELDIDPDLADENTLLAAVAAHPILLERPIVSTGRRAVIGRPPERVLELL